MTTVNVHSKDAFAIWITGLPASGKSTVAVAVKNRLARMGVDIAVLESDELRKVLSPHPRYEEEEREKFYRQLLYIGALLTSHGVPVIFDATANLRRYRDRARACIRSFLEVYVDTPIETCMARDPKGIYRSATQDPVNTVPGLKAPYEPPERPDVVVHGNREPPEEAADRIIQRLRELGCFRERPNA
jgi:adenylylsulfate kinase